MDLDIYQISEIFTETFTVFLKCCLSFSKSLNDHSATITTSFAFFAWFLYRQRTKRRLKIDVNLASNVSELLLTDGSVNPKMWEVELSNPGYYKVHVKEVGLLYREYCLGKSERFPISEKRIEVEQGDGMSAPPRTILRNKKPCPRKISGAYAIDGTGKVWSVCKKLKVEE